jgi:hypothetical protein
MYGNLFWQKMPLSVPKSMMAKRLLGHHLGAVGRFGPKLAICARYKNQDY